MTGIILLLISTFLFYLGIKGLKNKQKLSSKFPDKIEIKLNGNDYIQFIDDVNIGDKVKFWSSPKEKGEIRVYCSGTIGGQGLLSVFKNESIYNFLKEQKKKKNINLSSYVLEKHNHSLIVSLIKEENKSNEEERSRKFIEKLKKKYNPRVPKGFKPEDHIITFNTRFETDLRLTPKKFNDGLRLCFNINENDLEEVGMKLMDRNMGWEQSKKWLNSIYWLEFEGKKISIGNQTNTGESCGIIRSYFSDYDFKVEVQKNSSDTRLEKSLMEYGMKETFLYYFTIILFKKN